MTAGNGASGTEVTQLAIDRARRKSRLLALFILGAPVALPLDGDGNGGGKITVDSGPHSSVTFTLTVSPKAGGADVTASVKAKVTNFFVKLMMADGSPAPAGKKVALELNLSAGPDGTEPVGGPQAA